MANHVCTVGNIDVVLEREVLGPYAAQLGVAVERGVDKTGFAMKRESKAEAPVDGGKWQPQGFPPHREGGTFKRHISHRRAGRGLDHSFMWYVRSPEYRLTHLLSNGHRLFIFGKPTGRRTKADPFISDPYMKACATIAANIAKELPR